MRHEAVRNREGMPNMSRRLRQTTTVIVSDFAVEMFLGLHDFEQLSAQRVLLSVSLTLLHPSDFWDYDSLIDFFEQDIAGARIETQEELCELIIGFVEAGPPLHSIVVQTKKPDVFEKAKYVGLRRQVDYSDIHLE